jgi:hypothetical protein
MIDLVFSNINNISVSSVMYPLLPLDHMYHPAFSIKMSVSLFLHLSYKEQIYDFMHCNYYNIRSYIASVDWIGMLNNLNIKYTFHIFYENIFRIIDTSCSKKYLYTLKYGYVKF